MAYLFSLYLVCGVFNGTNVQQKESWWLLTHYSEKCLAASIARAALAVIFTLPDRLVPKHLSDSKQDIYVFVIVRDMSSSRYLSPPPSSQCQLKLITKRKFIRVS